MFDRKSNALNPSTERLHKHQAETGVSVCPTLQNKLKLMQEKRSERKSELTVHRWIAYSVWITPEFLFFRANLQAGYNGMFLLSHLAITVRLSITLVIELEQIDDRASPTFSDDFALVIHDEGSLCLDCISHSSTGIR